VGGSRFAWAHFDGKVGIKHRANTAQRIKSWFRAAKLKPCDHRLRGSHALREFSLA